MLRVAFATNDRLHVNLHFGAAESFVIYDVTPGRAELVGTGSFARAVMKGENRGRAMPDEVADEQLAAALGGVPVLTEDKVAEKIEFLADCAAVYASSIGKSSIKRLMAAEIQPIIVDTGHDIEDLLNEVSLALFHGGLAWVDRAKSSKAKAPDRFEAMEREGWPGATAAPDERVTHRLLTSVDDSEE